MLVKIKALDKLDLKTLKEIIKQEDVSTRCFNLSRDPGFAEGPVWDRRGASEHALVELTTLTGRDDRAQHDLPSGHTTLPGSVRS